MIQSAAFVGLGAVGAIYAQLAAGCAQTPCFAVVRDEDSYRRDPVCVNGEPVPIALVSGEAQMHRVDLVIFAVKWHALEHALGQCAPLIGEGTIVLSLLNGIDSEQVIANRFPKAHVLLSMCSGIDSNRKGHAVTMNRRGKIVLGERDGRISDSVKDVSAYFGAARIPHEVSCDMLHQMWWKLMVNVGMNQVSAVMGLDYEGMRSSAAALERMHGAQREVIAVANALGIALDERDMEAWDRQLAGLSCHGLSSTLQDVRSRRKTEVELYGGTICRLGRELNVRTPENDRLLREIRQIESAYL